jgi:cytoskeletal protein RodZ
MTENQFDDSVKNKIRDHRSPVPDDMWERIVQKKDKDRKGLLFFFRWLAVLVLGVCLGGFFLLNHTKQEPQQANHVSSGQNDSTGRNISSSRDRNLNATTPGSEEKERKEENSSDVVQHLPTSKKGSYPSQHLPTNKTGSYSSNRVRVTKNNKGNLKLASNEKAYSEKAISEIGVSEAAVAVAAAKGMQNSTSQKDSKAGDKGDSALNPTGVVNVPAAVVKPAPEKSLKDSAQKAAVKKTQEDSANNRKWYLDIYASPDLPMDHTENTFSSIMKLSYTVGLRINRAFGKHFSGKIGIQYSRINFGMLDSISYMHGTTNHLNSFDLPFLAGYSFGDEKLKMTITAGGILNISTSVPDSSLAYFFKKNTGFCLYFGFNLERKINQKISVYLEPYYRYRLSSMTISSVEFDKFIDVVGLSFGARIYFLKPTKK